MPNRIWKLCSLERFAILLAVYIETVAVHLWFCGLFFISAMSWSKVGYFSTQLRSCGLVAATFQSSGMSSWSCQFWFFVEEKVCIVGDIILFKCASVGYMRLILIVHHACRLQIVYREAFRYIVDNKMWIIDFMTIGLLNLPEMHFVER